MMKEQQLVARWIGAMAAIALALMWLQVLGRGDLGGPPLSVRGAASWLENRDAVTAAFAVVRVVAFGFGWYLLLLTAVGGAARLLRLRRLSSVVERLTFPFARGLLGGMALLGVMTAPPPVPPPTPDSMIELEEQATLHLLPRDPVESAPAPAPAPVAPAPVSAPAPTPASGEARSDAWVVQPGESFWSIAAEHLAEVSGRPVSDREVDSYWRQVVERNRSQLVNPSDVDLLFVGQEIELPAVASG